MTANIVIADDQTMIRKGIRQLLHANLNVKNIREADSCNSLMNELKKDYCSHIILDIIFGDGLSLEVVPAIRKLYPSIHMMIFTMQPKDIYADAFKQYHIEYYLLKTASEETTVNCIKRFLYNEPNTELQKKDHATHNPFSSLAPRELEILHYLLNGYKTQAIATTLNLSNSTISTFKRRILKRPDSLTLRSYMSRH